MAVRGEFSWPSLGKTSGRPWGILMAACGEFLMAIDNSCLALAISSKVWLGISPSGVLAVSVLSVMSFSVHLVFLFSSIFSSILPACIVFTHFVWSIFVSCCWLHVFNVFMHPPRSHSIAQDALPRAFFVFGLCPHRFEAAWLHASSSPAEMTWYILPLQAPGRHR